MAISVADNFSYLGGKPLDGRIQYDTVANMKAMADAKLYEGCEAYCIATDKYYKWKSTNTVDETLGKWREIESGGGGSYELPVATANTLGGVKVGSGLSITDGGILSADNSGGIVYVELADVTNASAVYNYTTGKVELKWTDPNDVVISGATFARWKNTTIVRKEGSEPTSPTDGTIILVSTTKNQYSTTAYEDTVSTNKNYYYRFFPCSKQDYYTDGSIIFTPTFNIYGVSWNGSSTGTRTGKSAGYQNPTPAVNNGNGSSPFDNVAPWNGIEIVDDEYAGKLVKIPKFWFKWDISGNNIKLQISDGAVDGFSVSPAHANRGDGLGERDYVYVGRYKCGDDYKSKTGTLPLLATSEDFISNVHSINSRLWQYDYTMRMTIVMLYLVEYANWDSQAAIGYGGGNGSYANTGYTDSMIYHTGTNAVNKTTAGGTQYRYIEGLMDNGLEMCAGIYIKNRKIYCISNPSEFAIGEGGVEVTTEKYSTNNYISKFEISNVSGYGWFLYPSETGNSSFVGDYATSSVQAGVSEGGIRYGSGNSYASYLGLFYQSFCTNGSNACSRLMKL